jgi:hypothetical protein
MNQAEDLFKLSGVGKPKDKDNIKFFQEFARRTSLILSESEATKPSFTASDKGGPPRATKLTLDEDKKIAATAALALSRMGGFNRVDRETSRETIMGAFTETARQRANQGLPQSVNLYLDQAITYGILGGLHSNDVSIEFAKLRSKYGAIAQKNASR